MAEHSQRREEPAWHTCIPSTQNCLDTGENAPQMTPPPCFCKVNCGTFSGISPLLLLAAAASLLSFVIASAAIARERRVQDASDTHIPGESSSSEDNSSSSSSSHGETDDDSDNDSKGNNQNLPDIARRVILTPAQIRADIESRLVSFRKDQDAALQQFQANNHRQRRIISDRTTADAGRLNSAVDDLRQRLVENKAELRDTNRAIRDLRSRVSASSMGSPSPPRRLVPPLLRLG